MPPRTGANWPDFTSKRVNSPENVRPTTKSFLPSLLGSGEVNHRGLEVSGMGWGPEGSKLPFRGRAQICPRDTKTKYFPSAVHLPQQSESGGLFQPGSKRCKSVPSTVVSQRKREPSAGFCTSNRKCLP